MTLMYRCRVAAWYIATNLLCVILPRLARIITRKCSSVLATNSTMDIKNLSWQASSLLRIASVALHRERSPEIRDNNRRKVQEILEVRELIARDTDGNRVRDAIDSAISRAAGEVAERAGGGIGGKGLHGDLGLALLELIHID